MCGRYTLTTPGEVLADLFELAEVPQLVPRFNIAPTQVAPVVRVVEEVTPAAEEATGPRRLDLLRWGLVPYWAEDPSIGNRMINARAETVATKPAYRSSFRRQRCLVVADGFYEWKKEGGGKQPYWIHRDDGAPVAFAGLWSRWAKGGEPLETFTILTRDATGAAAEIHHRMPVVLAREDWPLWLDPAVGEREPLEAVLAREPASLALRRVSRRVNSPANDNPECLEEWNQE
ncbi:MAG TPA: SOS response-associated peptidase [Thermoanaerobaculia bacterium]|nr:SOS response-associated peptidase [Thermoanaerobaculia bacterium]